jgi:hypothetical protein
MSSVVSLALRPLTRERHLDVSGNAALLASVDRAAFLSVRTGEERWLTTGPVRAKSEDRSR